MRAVNFNLICLPAMARTDQKVTEDSAVPVAGTLHRRQTPKRSSTD
jgi:hypothetical protein